MVQVDIFWSYGLGAGFAACAAGQIQKQAAEGKFKLLENSTFARALIFLGALFAPSGLYLLWQFPGWETMYVASSRDDIPAWLVVLFAITNVTQGILGFWITSLQIRKNRLYAAHLQWVFAYLIMFFILVNGWDGTGYRRFFTRTVAEWQAGSDELWTTMAAKWAVSPVALTLYAMGVIMLPLLFYWMLKGFQEGWELVKAKPGAAARPGNAKLLLTILRIIFLDTLGAAILGHLCIRYSIQLCGITWLGWIIGLSIWGLLLYFLALRRGGLFHREISKITFEPAT